MFFRGARHILAHAGWRRHASYFSHPRRGPTFPRPAGHRRALVRAGHHHDLLTDLLRSGRPHLQRLSAQCGADECDRLPGGGSCRVPLPGLRLWRLPLLHHLFLGVPDQSLRRPGALALEAALDRPLHRQRLLPARPAGHLGPSLDPGAGQRRQPGRPRRQPDHPLRRAVCAGRAGRGGALRNRLSRFRHLPVQLQSDHDHAGRLRLVSRMGRGARGAPPGRGSAAGAAGAGEQAHPQEDGGAQPQGRA